MNNRLAKEASPYLLWHKDDSADRYPFAIRRLNGKKRR